MGEPERRLLTPEEYREAHASPEFQELKRRFRAFAFPMTVAFLTWYLLYVLLSTYAPDFMGKQVFGNVSVGIIFGLLQFVTTFVITHLYVSHANKRTSRAAVAPSDLVRPGAYAWLSSRSRISSAIGSVRLLACDT